MTVEAVAQPFPATGAIGRQSIKRNPIVSFVLNKPLGAFGAAVLIVLVLTAIFADFIAPYDPIQQNVPYRLQPPDESFWFGTDIYGRDVFTGLSTAQESPCTSDLSGDHWDGGGNGHRRFLWLLWWII